MEEIEQKGLLLRIMLKTDTYGQGKSVDELDVSVGGLYHKEIVVSGCGRPGVPGGVKDWSSCRN